MRWLLSVAIVFLAALSPGSLLAQEVPPWTDEEYRRQAYPSEDYYLGFSQDMLPAGGSLGSFLSSLEELARTRLVEEIQLKINASSESVTQSLSRQEGEYYREQILNAYRQRIETSTSAVAVGVEVMSYYNSATRMAYALAVVGREDLANYYGERIELLLTRVEGERAALASLKEAGKKILARERCLAALAQLEEIYSWQQLYIAVKPDASAEVLQHGRYEELKLSLESEVIRLEQSTRLFLSCRWHCREFPEHEEQAEVVAQMLKSALSERGCTWVDQPDQADFILELKISTSLRSDGSGPYGVISYYANAVGQLYNCHLKRVVASISLQNDPRIYAGAGNHLLAVRKAFQQRALQEALLAAILPKIEN